MTWLRPLLLLGVAAVAFATLTAAVVSEVDRHREKAHRVLSERLEAVAAHVGDVDDALARHEHEAAVEAEAWRMRCRWEVVPAATRREVVTAVRLWTNGDAPVLVDLAR